MIRLNVECHATKECVKYQGLSFQEVIIGQCLFCHSKFNWYSRIIRLNCLPKDLHGIPFNITSTRMVSMAITRLQCTFILSPRMLSMWDVKIQSNDQTIISLKKVQPTVFFDPNYLFNKNCWRNVPTRFYEKFTILICVLSNIGSFKKSCT